MEKIDATIEEIGTNKQKKIFLAFLKLITSLHGIMDALTTINGLCINLQPTTS